MFRNHIRPAQYQRGSALVIAVFIIVVMSILATVLVRVLVSGSQATVDEVFGARAFHAANSGVQVFLTELFPLAEDGETATADSSVCTANRAYPFNTQGLERCEARLSCQQLSFPDYNATLFRIESTGQCAAGQMNYSRTVLVEVLDEQL